MDIVLQGIFLGLSTGLFCLGFCAPIFVPLMMSEKRRMAKCVIVVVELALGRFIAYLVIGAAAGYLGMLLEGPLYQRAVGVSMIFLSGLLILYFATRRWPHLTLCRRVNGRYFHFPVMFGFLIGISLCPPFLLAISYAIGLGDLTKGILLFGSFFLGTSVYLVMLLPLGYLGRWQSTHEIALMTTLISGVYFFLMGITRLVSL